MSGTRFALEVQPRIPQELVRLEELANDLLYSWDRSVRSLFFRLDPPLRSARDRDAIVASALVRDGADLRPGQSVFGTVSALGRIEDGELVNGRLAAEGRFYWATSSKSKFFAAVAGTVTEQLDEEYQLTLGGDNGLRGYPLRYQAGTARALFTVEQRLEMLRAAVGDDPRIEFVSFEGLLAEFARKVGASVVIRGLRAVSDFEYEFQMAGMNRNLHPEVETLFLTPAEQYMFISATIVREIAKFGGDVSMFVHPAVNRRLKAKAAGSAP